jgi:diguanylate cyclase (GGDEF)-like protein
VRNSESLSGLSVSDETRIVAETLSQVITGTQIVTIESLASSLGLELEALVKPGAERALEQIRERVRPALADLGQVTAFSCTVDGVTWGVLAEPIVVDGGDVVGALIVARQGRAWSKRERSLTKTFSDLLGHASTQAVREGDLLRQQSLDELVSKVAVKLMSGSAENRREILYWTTRELAEFLGSDVAFMRSHDHARGLSIFESSWPVREDIPDPDPLGEVPFDADPIFEALWNLKEPYLTGVDDVTDEFVDRVEKAAGGLTPITGAAVPLMMGDVTWGVLGFLYNEPQQWSQAEVNALQAVAAMIVHLEARIVAEERIIYNANHDELTGLPNRRALIQVMKERLEARRQTAVMVIDLDRFKIMNDFLGHANGDRLLITMSDRIRTSIRSSDFAARLGGDEFVFLVDKARSEMEVLASAYRMLDIIAEPVEIFGQQVNHTASIGIAIAGTGVESGLDLLGRADVAMYEAKARGRNQAVVFDSVLKEAVDERSRTELMLQEAIDNGGLRLHYQPEVDLITGSLIAVEALVRWEHPTRGLLAASEFIKVAEETGLVTNIGRWVFAEACRQLGQWRREYPNLELIVRVNMSPADFKMGDLVEFVQECLAVNGVPGNRFCIEITEYAVLDDPDKTARILKEFQSLGVEIALDDFGTGFATMTGLKNLPVNLLKLDLSFVSGIVSDPYDRAIVESIIRLGKALNLGVIAEGIEDTQIVDKLLELGCHRGQGYLISRPVAAGALAPMLRAGSAPQSLLRSPGVTSSALAAILPL